MKKSVKSKVVNDIFKNKSAEERNQSDKILNQDGNASMNVVSANNSMNGIRERNLRIPEQSCSVTFSSTSTSLALNKKISEGQQKLVNSVFSSITKRKSTNDEEDQKEKEIGADCIDLGESVPQSPPRCQVTKRARLVFQKCFQNTFDPRMLPGHDTILVGDSDENNSD